MPYEFVRNIQDAAVTVVKALPAANANHNTDVIDLEQTTGGQIENIAFEVSVPATPALADTKLITIKLYDGATSGSLAAVDPLISTTIVGVATGQGGVAKTVRFRLPPGVRRYVALNLAVENAGGDNTGVDVTFKLLA